MLGVLCEFDEDRLHVDTNLGLNRRVWRKCAGGAKNHGHVAYTKNGDQSARSHRSQNFIRHHRGSLLTSVISMHPLQRILVGPLSKIAIPPDGRPDDLPSPSTVVSKGRLQILCKEEGKGLLGGFGSTAHENGIRQVIDHSLIRRHHCPWDQARVFVITSTYYLRLLDVRARSVGGRQCRVNAYQFGKSPADLDVCVI